MPINYSSLYSFENVDPIIKRKRLKEITSEKPSPKPYWGDPSKPDPSITGTLPENPLGRNARDVLTGKGGTPPINGEGGNYLGIPQKTLGLAFGLSALSHAVNPKGPGKELMHYAGSMMSENARIGERARELMREEQRSEKDRELTYQRDLEKEQRTRGYKLEDVAEERRYNEPLRSAQIKRYEREPQGRRPTEFELFQSNRRGKINPKTNQPYSLEENLGDYKSLGRAEKSGDDEKTALKEASAELKSLGAEFDKEENSIDFSEEMESTINKALKKHGISFYPAKSSNEGMKKYYLGGYNKGQVSQPSGTTFNLEDYLPK